MMRMFLWVAISIVFTVAPFMSASVGAALGTGGQLMVSGFGAAMLVGGITVVTITRLYVRAAANEAFVKTGMGGTRVILDGGALIIPVVHELVKVPLTTTRLDVDRSGPDSLITADKLRADLKAEFYIRVLPQTEDIQNAARSLGNMADDPSRIAQLVNDKLISALRSVAANKTLEELNTRRNEFAGEVKQQVEPDLKHNGLTLETVTISKLDQTDPKNLKADNVFDAQGLKRITEITTDAAVRRNELEQSAQKMIKERNVQTRLEILQLERQQAEAEATQSADVAKVKALKESEARQAQIEQEQAVAAREVEKTRALKAADLEAQQKVLESERQRELAEVNKSNAVEMAMIDAEKKVKDAERTRELTEVDKQKAIETANQEKAMTVAVAQAKRADAEREQFTKMALREKAAQDVETVKVTSAAEREGDQKLIAASKAAEQDLVREQRKADGAAYTIQKEAEAKKAAAQAEYEARLKAAEAESESAKKRAEGAQAEQMVAVHVQQKLVEVEQQKVEVESRRLEVQEKFGKAAIELQVRLKEIEASAQIEVERARAMGAMLSRGEFTIYGDPTTFARMMEAFSKGASIRQTVEGFLAEKGTDDNLSRVVNAAAEVIGKVTGKSKKADGGPGAEKA